MTNTDRTVHLSEQAVEPPGRARSDLDIFLDYARRMDFRDRDGAPFPQWHDAESAFEAWKRASAGRPCDYTGLTYAGLRGGSGVQWPCTAERPQGTERLYTDVRFWAAPTECESYGRDLITGAPAEPVEYAAMNPFGRAVIRAAEYLPPHEEPDGRYPFALVTGRTLYHFHTRTKTGRVPQLNGAAPQVWVEIAGSDAREAGIGEGDLVEVALPRGAVRGRARISGIRPGVLFVPFHYGYWDAHGPDRDRAANETTATDWDPVSKQPLFKTSAARLRLLRPSGGEAAPAPTTTASRPATAGVPATTGGPGGLCREDMDGGAR